MHLGKTHGRFRAGFLRGKYDAGCRGYVWRIESVSRLALILVLVYGRCMSSERVNTTVTGPGTKRICMGGEFWVKNWVL